MNYIVHLQNLLNFGSLGYRMHVARRLPDGRYEQMQSPTITVHEPFTPIKEDEAFLDDSKSFGAWNVREFLQAMSDAAWEIGIKPKQVEGHASELQATKFHLEDMRQLAGVRK